MRLYLVRHGIAEDRGAWSGPDDTRPLTAKGARGVERIAAAMARAGVEPTAIISSPLTRAEQTARILSGTLGAGLVIDSRIADGFRAADLAAICDSAGAGDEVMVVGHEPTLGDVLQELTGARVYYKKGACARVDLEDCEEGAGLLVWLLTPALAGE